jgi:hypothetical protein
MSSSSLVASSIARATSWRGWSKRSAQRGGWRQRPSWTSRSGRCWTKSETCRQRVSDRLAVSVYPWLECERLLCLYRASHHLAETAVYVALFRLPHQDDENAVTSWDNFVDFLPTHERWPDVVA